MRKLRKMALLLPLIAIIPTSALIIVEHRDSNVLTEYHGQQFRNLSNALKNDIGWIDYTSPKETAKNLESLVSKHPYILGTEVFYKNGISSRYGNVSQGQQTSITIDGENVESVTFNFASPPISNLSLYLGYAAAGSLLLLVVVGVTSLRRLQFTLFSTKRTLRASERSNMHMIEASERDRAYRWISLQTVIDVVRPGLFNTTLLLEMLEKINSNTPLYQHPDTFIPGLIINRVVEELEPHLGDIANLGCTNIKDSQDLIAYTYPSYYGNIVSILLSIAHSIGRAKITIEYSFHVDANGIGNLITRICNCSVGIPKSRISDLKKIFDGSIDAVSTGNIDYLVAHRCAQIMNGKVFLNSNSLDWTEFTVQLPISTTEDPFVPPAAIFNDVVSPSPMPRVLIIGDSNTYIINQLYIMGIRAVFEEAFKIDQHELSLFDIVLVNRPTFNENQYLTTYFHSKPQYSIERRNFQILCTGNIDPEDVIYTSEDNVLGTCLESKIIELIHSHLKVTDQIQKISHESTALTRL